MANFGEGYRYHVTGLVHDETGFPSNSSSVADKLVRRLMDKIETHKDDIIQWEEQNTEDADIVIVSIGGVSRASDTAMKMLRAKGLKVGTFRPITVWPFPEKRLQELAERVKTFVVAEMNLGQMVLEVERIIKGKAEIKRVNKVNGEAVYPEEITAVIEEVL
ncbi:hypothetical protein SDC9_155977 [bioreactor metagenome]|uniref:Pyruvate:ferredoxin oxidoreductase core domain-containing protein n=1 Tax=bioreactor metagenome TaxID=1076179 RepID=A0A645F5A5_9ZZZZ